MVNRSRGNLLAFVDLLFQVLMGVTVLLWLVTLLINDPGKREVDTVADALVTLDWPANIPSDMDLWVMDPLGHIAGYTTRSQGSGFLSLERDDLGYQNDTFSVGGKTYVTNENGEVMTIRNLIPGEYSISVHFFAPHSNKSDNPTPVTVKVIKVNPEFKMVFKKIVTVDKPGDEMFMFRFTVQDNGSIGGIEEEPPSHFLIGNRITDGRMVSKKNEIRQGRRGGGIK